MNSQFRREAQQQPTPPNLPSTAAHTLPTASLTSAPVSNLTSSTGPGQIARTPMDWNTEDAHLHALAQLQALSNALTELRTLSPDRVFAPIAQIVEATNSLNINENGTNGTNQATVTTNGATAASTQANGAAQTQSGTQRRATSLTTSAGTPHLTPSDLHAALMRTSTAGQAEIADFKALYSSPELTRIWEHVNARAAADDAGMVGGRGDWAMDYEEEADKVGGRGWTFTSGVMLPERTAPVNKTVTLADDVKAAVEASGVKTKTGVKFEPQSSEDFLVTLVDPKITMRVKKKADGTWDVATQDGVESKDKIEKGVLKFVSGRKDKKNLKGLLSLLASYSSIKTEPCWKCKRLLGNKNMYPMKRSEVAKPGGTTAWLAEHLVCASI